MNLRAAIETARVSAESWQTPFGAVVAGPDGTILMVQENQAQKLHNPTKHPESALASRFVQKYYKNRIFRANSTLYSSAEPCAMCMYTIFSAGIGRVVYGLSADRLYGIFNQYGDMPRINLTSREATALMNHPMIIAGPYLEDEIATLVESSLVQLKAHMDKGAKKRVH